MASLDSVLNFAIPALLIAIAIGFIYMKFLEPYLVPLIMKMWNYQSDKPNEHKQKEIIYGDTI